MQIAGINCAACKTKIFIDAEGTWCGRCKSVLHRKCIEKMEGYCAVCAKPVEPAEKSFRYARVCWNCGLENTPPQPACRICDTATRYDTPEEYEATRRDVRRLAAKTMIKGLAATTFGGILLAGGGILLIVNFSAFGDSAGRAVLASPVPIVYGILSLAKARRLRQFE